MAFRLIRTPVPHAVYITTKQNGTQKEVQRGESYHKDTGRQERVRHRNPDAKYLRDIAATDAQSSAKRLTKAESLNPAGWQYNLKETQAEQVDVGAVVGLLI